MWWLNNSCWRGAGGFCLVLVHLQLGNDCPGDTDPRERTKTETASSLHPTPLQQAHVGREPDETRYCVSDATCFLNKQKDLTVIKEKYACYWKKTQTHQNRKVKFMASVCIYLDDSLGQSFSPGSIPAVSPLNLILFLFQGQTMTFPPDLINALPRWAGSGYKPLKKLPLCTLCTNFLRKSGPCSTLPCPLPRFVCHAQFPWNQFTVAVNHICSSSSSGQSGWIESPPRRRQAFAPSPGCHWSIFHEYGHLCGFRQDWRYRCAQGLCFDSPNGNTLRPNLPLAHLTEKLQISPVFHFLLLLHFFSFCFLRFGFVYSSI